MRLETREDAYRFLTSLKEEGYKAYWHRDELTRSERLVISKPPHRNLPSYPPSVAKRIMALLDIGSKEDWEAEKHRWGSELKGL